MKKRKKVSYTRDPEFDEFDDEHEPMAEGSDAMPTEYPQDTTETQNVGEQQPGDAPEVKPVKVTGPVNIKGATYAAGDVVFLTEEECATLTELKAPIEGVEAATEEEVQAAHDESRAAQNAEVEVRAKEEAEKEARDEAYDEGVEFDEAKFSEGYDRQKKLSNPEYEPPAPREKAS